MHLFAGQSITSSPVFKELHACTMVPQRHLAHYMQYNAYMASAAFCSFLVTMLVELLQEEHACLVAVIKQEACLPGLEAGLHLPTTLTQTTMILQVI